MKAVIFDLDGTLLDRESSLLSFLEDQYVRFRGLQKIDKQAFVNRFVELDCRGYVWKDAVYQQMIQECGLDMSWEELLEDYITNFHRHCIGFPNLLEVLDLIKQQGLKLGLLSNGYGQFQYANVQGLGIEAYFDCILISEWEGLRKPDPAIFHRALYKLSVRAEEAIYVGDHPDNDVRASRAIGMTAIWKEDKYYEIPAEADAMIRDLLDLKLYLLEL
ncbi:L-2-haloalkanoic acid dehalogenase [Paenibacillus sp. E194]|uniref:HAD family hydrolase n=1 Tax=Paenibacillus sp. E194 TaxID=1458845 RepID=UPI0005E25686|nr:HAD-IA family hydrolase [Paenibacillus sp. E194]KJB86109.1 L-2-haloalkanoic acid dehalogenase [Paenibacillus sp. E194]